jgi:integrase
MSLKITRRHGSPNWYLRGTVRGVEVDETTKTDSKEHAEAIKAKREWEIINRQLSGNRSATTFLDAALAYTEGGGEARFVQALADHFRETPLAEIGQAEVEACARKLYPRLKPSTINRMVFTPVSAIITHAAKRKLAERPSFERPTQPKGRVQWLTHEEADRLIEACAPHLKPIVTFLFYTGARVSEALTLDWRDVDLKRSHVVFLDDPSVGRSTKNGESRGIPLHPRAWAALANLKHREGPVFLRPARRPNRNADEPKLKRRLTPGAMVPYEPKDGEGGQIKTAFKGACARAKIKNFHPHDCRHTWATWHYSANRDLRALMELGGWKTMSMVQRYTHINADHLAASVLRIGAETGQKSGDNTLHVANHDAISKS